MTDTTNTPTPEMDAFERDVIACIPEELHQMQAYARKGRELETRLTVAEAEVSRLRGAEPVVWAKPIEHEDVCQCPKCGVFHDTTGAPLYRSPAPDVEVVTPRNPDVNISCMWFESTPKSDDSVHAIHGKRLARHIRAMSALAKGAKK